MLALLLRTDDLLGVLASALCFIHCIATPFIFIAQTCSATCFSNVPYWWQVFDFVFLFISLIAIYRSARVTSISWLKPALWISWLGLVAAIVIAKIDLFSLSWNIMYIPAMALVVFHLYNHRFGRCPNSCCDK